MKIADLMSRRVHVAGPELDAETAWWCLQQLHVCHLVVVDNREQVIGLLSEREQTVKRRNEEHRQRKARERRDARKALKAEGQPQSPQEPQALADRK